MNDLIVGIDLGTTNSLVAVAGWPEGGSASVRAPRVLVDASGRAMVPSVVRFDAAVGGQPALVVVGDRAKDEAALHPRTTIASVKRLMGRSVADSAADLPYLSYAVVEGPNNTARVAIPLARADGDGDGDGNGNGDGDGGVRVVSPQEVSAHILKTLKDRASAALGVPVSKAVVTVPAYFDDAQRQATRDAGRLAGLEVVRIVAEPTAAALAYGLGVIGRHNEHEAKVPRIVAVYDFGGGTFDVSILRLTPGGTVAGVGADAFEVLSTSGDTHLGGDDLDFALVAMMLGELGLSGDAVSPTIKRTLLMAAERAKVELSERAEARVDVAIDGRTERYGRLITRAELELLIAPFVERTLQICRRALRDAQRAMADDDGKAASISAVVMVGGSTRIPLVRAKVAEMFGVEPYTAIDPDQAVAIGAAVQASVLAGTSSQAMLLDVIPLSLGIETVGGAVAKLIMRNSPVPARAKEMFSTGTDDQTGIKLAVYQGEREMAADCRLLGRFEIKGIPPMPAGIPKLQVEFFIDASGVLSVSAVELRSGKRATLQVVPNHGLSPAEVDSIERESFANARDDMQRHRIVDLVANSKLDVQWIDKQLVKNGGLLEVDVRQRIERASSELKTIISSAAADWRSVDADTFAKAKEELDRSSMRLHEVSIAASLREA